MDPKDDGRGLAFHTSSAIAEFLGAAEDIHFLTVAPGAVRGNHYNETRHQVIVVMATDRFTIYWDEERPSGVEGFSERFDEDRLLGLWCIPPRCSNAIRNDGERPLWIAILGNDTFDPQNPGKVTRIVCD